ncbi:MAG: SusE domain-containing protein, partial [Bacteroidales bacterium]
MKRIFNIVMVVLLGFIAASCEQPAFNPVYNPADAVAPVLSEIQAEYTLEDGGAFDTFTFSKAEFGIPVAVKYTVYVALAGTDFAKSKTLETVTSNTNGITVSANKLNTALISLGAV